MLGAYKAQIPQHRFQLPQRQLLSEEVMLVMGWNCGGATTSIRIQLAIRDWQSVIMITASLRLEHLGFKLRTIMLDQL
jgi:hypothetical protein